MLISVIALNIESTNKFVESDDIITEITNFLGTYCNWPMKTFNT